MNFTETMRFLTICVVLLGFACNALGQGRITRRVLRVRKTGEFGRRIAPISTFYEPPRRHLSINEPFLQTSETRRSDRLVGVRKPSQKLELPFFSQPAQDSVAEESEERLQGYAYPKPTNGNDQYDNMQMQGHPLAEYPETQEDVHQAIDESPAPPTSPEREAEIRGPPKPFGVESEQEIDAQHQTPTIVDAPKPVKSSSEADTNVQCDENDHNCWPHGYKGEIPGEAGQDYPILSEIVDTPFDCENVQNSGYYADTDEQARCQIFHICLKGNAYRKTQKWSFLCPNGTVFSQGDFVCVWWTAAPECSSGVVDELALRNIELGWDNLTETESRNAGNFDVRFAMSNLFNANNANLQTSSSDSRLKNAFPASTTTTTTRKPVQPSRNSIPYRVPVKVNTGMGSRTKLKEVSGNGIQGPAFDSEYTGQESETYETSLQHQSESRHKTKTASALKKSESEAYEQKSLAPFVVNRRPIDEDTEGIDALPESQYENGEHVTSEVVMMATQQKNPDGSEGFAEIPVMLTGGYKYPNPTSTPGPQYLPPRKEYSPPKTTTETPTTTTQFSEIVTDETIGAEQGYQYTNPTTEQSALDASLSPEVQETTTEQSGYNYPAPTTTEEQSGYNYPVPTTTEEEPVGYQYQNPTTTEQDGYNYANPTTSEATLAEEDASSAPVQVTEGGYDNYESVTQETTQRVTTPATTTLNPSKGYLPPKTDEPKGYSYARPSEEPIGLSLPNTEATESDDNDALNNKLAFAVTNNPDDISNADDLSTVDNNAVSGGYPDGEVTSEYQIPTPSSDVASSTGDQLDSDDKVNQILKEIQKGGAEVRDENGKKLDFAELKKLIMNTPSGLLALQKADEDIVSTSSPTTEVTTEESVNENETEVTPEGTQGPTLETVQTIEDNPGQYLPPQTDSGPQENYFTNNRVINIKQPGYEISAPAREYENHSLQQNSIDPSSVQPASPTIFSGYSSAAHTTQSNQQSQDQPPQYVKNQQNSNFGSLPQSGQTYYVPQTPEQSFHSSQSQSTPEVNYVRASVPQPQQQYQQEQPRSQPQQNFIANVAPQQQQDNSFYQNFQSQRIQPTTLPQQHQQYYQTQTQQSISPQPTQFFQQQNERSNENSRYLPPAPSTPRHQSQSYLSSSLPTNNPFQPRAVVAPPRDLTKNIQLQQSYSLPIPQASTSRQQFKSPLDIKIVPALLVDQHTRVENPDGSEHTDKSVQNSPSENSYQQQSHSSNYNSRQLQFSSNNGNNNNNRAYGPYSSQSENIAVKLFPPRLNSFTYADALPKGEPFTAADSVTAEQVLQYQRDSRKFQRDNPRRVIRPTTQSMFSSTRYPTNNAARNFVGSGSRGYLELPSDEQSSVSNSYPGKDRSLGVSLAYN